VGALCVSLSAAVAAFAEGEDDPPVVTTTQTTLAYSGGDGAKVVDPGLAIAGPQGGSVLGAVVDFGSGFMAGRDRLAFPEQDEEIIAGTFNEDTGVLTLEGLATLEDYRGALRSVTYEHTGTEPGVTAKTVRFQVTDGSEQSSNIASRSIQVTIPEPEPEAPAVPRPVIESAPATQTNDPDAAFAFSGVAGGSFECSIDDSDFTPCGAAASFLGLAEGVHELRVRQVKDGTRSDVVGFSWTVDTVAPLKPEFDPSTSLSATGAAFAFLGEPGGAFQCALDDGPFTACVSPQVYTGLDIGDHRFRVRQVDDAGNTGPVARLRWAILESGPASSFLPSPSSSLTSGGRTVDVDCAITEGSLKWCAVRAYLDTGGTAGASKRVKIGHGKKRVRARNDVLKTTVKLVLNKRGRRALRRHPEGLDVVLKITAKSYLLPKLREARRATLVSG